ncbi:MAG: phosphatidate cytidylyltransferase [Campylobacteraceae bacterium]|jgi:phosphatidate cytidylyltransferase|nr:phosphatidate cytidylyltransferase [Campylobacteraceae bacterium]
MDKQIDGGKKRLITGFALLGAALVIILLNKDLITWFAIGVITFFAFSEVISMLKIEDNDLYIYGAITWITAYFYARPEILIFVVLMILLGHMAYKNSVNYKKIFPILYPLAPMIFIWTLVSYFGMWTLVWLIFIVGATDTAAYYVGKSIGSTQFSPVSPKKTWEGFFGGVIAGTTMGTVIGFFSTPFLVALIVSLLVSIASIFGDLFESYIKRSAGVKDSGNILPGHGGMLDRVDGYLFGAVIMAMLLNIFVAFAADDVKNLPADLQDNISSQIAAEK